MPAEVLTSSTTAKKILRKLNEIPLFFVHENVVLDIILLKVWLRQHFYIHLIRAVATAPEKTPTEKVKFSEL